MAELQNIASSSLADNIIGKTESAVLVINDFRTDKNGNLRLFPVQFNPAQIQLYVSCQSGSKSSAVKPNSSNSPKVVVDTPTYPSVEMTVTLLFDAVFPADSFMWEKYSTGLTSAVSAQNIKTIASAAQKKVYSVQPQIEALIAALRDPYTRIITFCWADFSFKGQVNQIMSKYTMFSVSGRPVRGEVTLRLRQSSDDIESIGKWSQAFEDAFGGDSASSSLVRPGQKSSSLINFNF